MPKRPGRPKPVYAPSSSQGKFAILVPSRQVAMNEKMRKGNDMHSGKCKSPNIYQGTNYLRIFFSNFGIRFEYSVPWQKIPQKDLVKAAVLRSFGSNLTSMYLYLGRPCNPCMSRYRLYSVLSIACSLTPPSRPFCPSSNPCRHLLTLIRLPSCRALISFAVL